MCELLHEKDLPRYNSKPDANDFIVRAAPKFPKVYEDLHKWWDLDSQCRDPHTNEQYYHYIRG